MLLYVDRALIHEGSSHAFEALEAEGRKVARPQQIFALHRPLRADDRAASRASKASPSPRSATW